MSVAVGQRRPQPHRATPWPSQTTLRTRSPHRRFVALVTMMILAISVIMGVSASQHIAPAGELPQPSGNAQPAPVPNR